MNYQQTWDQTGEDEDFAIHIPPVIPPDSSNGQILYVPYMGNFAPVYYATPTSWPFSYPVNSGYPGNVNMPSFREESTAPPSGPFTNKVINKDSVQSSEELEIVRKIGAGSSAEVYLVKHKYSGQLYALKEIQMSSADPIVKIGNEIAINLQQRENVVQCFQVFFEEAKILILLEYMDGGSFESILKGKGPISEPFLAEVSRQALNGLLSLHRDHIIHRDIKPSNLLLNRSGQVKITDFGVSTLLTSTMDVGFSFVGTHTYMAPERLNCGVSGKGHSYNSDIWSLGLSILELAIGQFPYKPSTGTKWTNFYALLNAVVESPPPQAPTEQFSTEFCSFIRQCLEKDPEKRVSVSQALEHPFLAKYSSSHVNLLSLCLGA